MTTQSNESNADIFLEEAQEEAKENKRNKKDKQKTVNNASFVRVKNTFAFFSNIFEAGKEFSMEDFQKMVGKDHLALVLECYEKDIEVFGV